MTDRFKANPGDITLSNGISAVGDAVGAVPINENLFIDEDLDALDDELNDLNLDK